MIGYNKHIKGFLDKEQIQIKIGDVVEVATSRGFTIGRIFYCRPEFLTNLDSKPVMIVINSNGYEIAILTKEKCKDRVKIIK